MSSISDKLKSLGVSVGPGKLSPPKPREVNISRQNSIENVLAGKWQSTPHGEIYVVEKFFPYDHKVGKFGIQYSSPLNALAKWAQDIKITNLSIHDFAFIDTETTGLSGGAGTLTFLIGVGRFIDDHFHLAQFFLADPAKETAQLRALEDFLAPCKAIVTFNGKSFDVPLLNNRYTMNRWPSPFGSLSHVDLLHISRRLWRDRLSSCSLGNLEFHILGISRTEEDIPGWMIPAMFREYLLSGDARPLKKIIYHNEMDVISMAALLNVITTRLADPIGFDNEHGEDVIAVGKLFEHLGDFEVAMQAFTQGLTLLDPDTEYYQNGRKRLSFLYKRSRDYQNAIKLWEKAAQNGEIYAFIELAKVYEHKFRKLSQARYWTNGAIDWVLSESFPDFIRSYWIPDLKHRLSRLERKLSVSQNEE